MFKLSGLNFTSPKPGAFVGPSQIQTFFTRYCQVLDEDSIIAAGYDPADVGPDDHYYRLVHAPPAFITFPGINGRHNFTSTWEAGQIIHSDWCL